MTLNPAGMKLAVRVMKYGLFDSHSVVFFHSTLGWGTGSKLKEFKHEVQIKVGKEETSGSSSYSDGLSEVMDDIVKAMNALTLYLRSNRR